MIKEVRYLFLEPAYGRRYETEEQAIKDWKDGKDFKIFGGPYCSIRDLAAIIEDLDNPTVLIEYSYNKFFIV